MGRRNGARHPLHGFRYLLTRLQEAARECVPAETAPPRWPRFKFVARGLVYGIWMKRWFEFLDIAPMRPIVGLYSRLYLKVQWPYLNRRYGPGRRLDIVRHHYRFLLNRIKPELRARLLDAKFLTLARWEAPEIGPMSLRLSHENRFSQEGEMVLSLHQEEPERLCGLLCFSISGHSELSIGCLQGAKPLHDAEPTNKDFYVLLTRRLHGLRPKNLLLFALHQLATAWSVGRLRAVGNRHHIFRENLRSDYDTFWTEAGGVPDRDGMYDLPPALLPREPAEIPPKKRAMYRRRYQFLDTLEKEIAATLAAPQRELETFAA